MLSERRSRRYLLGDVIDRSGNVAPARTSSGQIFGDDIALRAGLYSVDQTDLAQLRLILGRLALAQEMFYPLTLGAQRVPVGVGLSVLKTGVLSRRLGWTAITLGVIAAVPSHVLPGLLYHIGFGAFIGLCLWTALVSILLSEQVRQ